MAAPEAEIEIQETDILVSGVTNRNRAIHGDTVGVQILPKNEWVNSSGITSPTPCGKVVYVEKTPNCGSTRTYFCVLRSHAKNYYNQECRVDWSTNAAIKAVPLDRRIPWIMVFKLGILGSKFNWLTEEPELPQYDIFEVSIVGWKIQWNLPQGELVRHIGQLGTPKVEEEAILAEYLLSEHRDVFTLGVIEATQEIVAADSSSTDKAIGRRDMRSCNCITIDPKEAKDLDDAIHIKRRFNKEPYYEIGVHIADVSHYVKPKSIIDQAAQRRSTTVYFPHRAFHMIPAGLSTDLCSLDMGKDKLTFTCVFNLDDEGRLMDEIPVRFFKSIICSRYKLSYDEVHDLLVANRSKPATDLDSTTMDDYRQVNLISDLVLLEKLTQKIRHSRSEGGCLSLNNAEYKFTCNPETWKAEDVLPVVRNSSHEMIEELMILTNRLVATKLMEGPLRNWSVFRYQPPIKPGRLQEVEAIFHKAGYEDIRFEDDIGKCLKLAKEKHGPKIGLLLEVVLSDCLNLARYDVYGHSDFVSSHHYCLAIECYTHFTSPIRRYPDIVVHRLLEAAMHLESLGYTEPIDPDDDQMPPEMIELLEELDLYDIEELHKRSILWNEKKLLADYAFDRAQNTWLCMFVLENKNIPKTLGYILQVQDRSCMVTVPAFNLKRRLEFLTSTLERFNQKIRPEYMVSKRGLLPICPTRPLWKRRKVMNS